MRLFDRISIKRSLLLIALLSNGAGVILLSAVLGIGEWATYRERAATMLTTYAGVVAGNIVPALLFEDDKAAREVLGRLIVEPSIVHATLLDHNGEVVAWLATGRDAMLARPALNTHLFMDDQIVLAREVRHEGDLLGSLYLQSDLRGAHRELLGKLALIGGAMSLALAFSLFLFVRLQRTISEPLDDLSAAMVRVTRDGDYEGRVAAGGGEEIRALAWGFNTMLDAIGERERTLAEHRADLEKTVRLRTEELRELNSSLEQRVREEAGKSREKDHLLIRQSRLATLGEMIGNIAHQWRQPLNALGLLLTNLKDAQRFGELDQAHVEAAVEQGRHLIDSMSATIDDFRNLFKPDRDKTCFTVAAAVREALSVIWISLRNANIEVVLESDESVACEGFFNEYTHVMLNILGNARDAIRAKGIMYGKVTIRIGVEEGRAVVVIRDNGGGIPEAVIERIFDPYFTTRENGTGIGLYMSLMIIEKNMGGAIAARNIDGGAEFRILTPLAKEIPA